MPGLCGNRLNLNFLHMLDKVLKLTTDILVTLYSFKIFEMNMSYFEFVLVLF